MYAAADGRPELATMGTTVAGAVVLAESLLAFNVGDSRVFDAAEDGLRQVSVDDSPPPAPGRRTTSAVTQTLGGSREFSAVTPHVTAFPLSAGDRYLVCTDGLTDPVPDDELDGCCGCTTTAGPPSSCGRPRSRPGGPDNITLAVVRIGE